MSKFIVNELGTEEDSVVFGTSTYGTLRAELNVIREDFGKDSLQWRLYKGHHRNRQFLVLVIILLEVTWTSLGLNI